MSLNARTLSRRSFVGAALSLPFALAACGGSAGSTTEAETTAAPAEESEVLEPGTIQGGVLVSPLDNGYGTGTHHATIEVQNFGTIKVELNADIAPITVSNFADLVESGFYDGLTFHRIIKGFMIQGGDPMGNGMGGSDRLIKGEFSANGVVNAIQHKRGVISMARAQANDSASSQFFIMHADADHLDGQYAACGKVTEGMDVVDAIADNVPVEDNNGTVASANQPVITSIKMDD